jgi:hypothetical protein
MTCPEIGNYGVSSEDVESRGAAGGRLHHPRRIADGEQLAVETDAARLSRRPSKIVAISDIDTRALTRQLRSGGVMRGVIGTGSGLDPRRSSSARARFRRWKVRSGPRRHDDRAFDWARRDPDEFGVLRRRAKRREDRGLRLRHEMEHPAAPERARLRRPRLPGDTPASELLGDEP